MKNWMSTLLCALIASAIVSAQDYSTRYGKITDYELKMTTYVNDTSASAVVLYEDGRTYFDINGGDFRSNFEISKKIKILKQEGVDNADISIPFYFESNSKSERISNLEAFTYNLENGKVVKTKLDKKYIFEEQVNPKYRQLKFSFPNVKEGSIIEYKFTKTSPYYEIPDWDMQSDIPIRLTKYEVLVPEYLHFNMASKGLENIQTTTTRENQQLPLGNGNIITCTSIKRTFIGQDMPALKDEPYVWCLNDFTTGIRFELNAVQFPNDFLRPYTRTWENLEETLRTKTEFGSQLKISNPYKNEIKELIANESDETKIIELIYAFLKDKIKWDETYSLYGTNTREAIRKGIGNNGQFNMILISALKDANIKTTPILISRRTNGRLSFSYPSIDKLSTFIVAAETSDGKTYYLDGSATHGGLSMLPVNLLVDRGRIFNSSNVMEKWVDLTGITKNIQVSAIMAHMNNDGTIKGEITNTYTNQLAYSYKNNYFNRKDSTDYIDNLKNSSKISINQFKAQGIEPLSNKVIEIITFEKDLNLNENYIYLNPLILPHYTKNEFTQSNRKLPVEFNYPYNYSITCNITIPNNFVVEELPTSQRFVLGDNLGTCVYYIKFENGILQINYLFDLKNTIFTTESYSIIQDFFGKVASKNAEMVVLKKLS